MGKESADRDVYFNIGTSGGVQEEREGIVAPDYIWLLLVAPGCIWLLMFAPGCIWLLLAAPGCI